MLLVVKYFLWDLVSRWFNITGIISGTTTWFLSKIEGFEPAGAGTTVGIMITAGIGIFSLLKAYQSWRNKIKEDLDAAEKRKDERDRVQEAFEAEEKRKQEKHELEMKELEKKIDNKN